MLHRTIKISLLLLMVLMAGSVRAADIWIEPDTTYFQRDTFVTVTVMCDAAVQDVKGFHFDIDLNDAGIVIAPAPETSDTSVLLGSMFVDNDTSTFMWNYLWEDSSRLSVDIFVLTDSQTVSGPGELLVIRVNTIAFGESKLEFGGVTVRDRFNQDIDATTEGAWIKVCQFVGDVNADNRIVIDDLTYLVDYLFRGGPAPTPYAAGDLDCSGDINIADVTAMVAYLFQGGTIDCALCL